MKNKWLKSPYLVIFGLLFFPWLAIVIMAYFLGRVPLVPTLKWQVKTVTHSGMPVSVKTYRMIGRDEPLLIHVTGDSQTSVYDHYSLYDQTKEDIDAYWRERWFAVFINEEGALVTSMQPGPDTFPCLNYNPDKNFGIPILHGKLEEEWFLARVGDSVVFSNRSIAVSVSRGDVP